VLLQEKYKPGKPWVTQKQDTLSRDGYYLLTDRPTSSTRHSYRIVMPATKHHARGVSPTVRVTVYGWQNLTSRDPVDAHGIAAYPSVDIGGRTYPDSLRAVQLEDPADAWIEYDLEGRCYGFRGRFGLSDTSESGASAAISASAAGDAWFMGTFGLGESTHDVHTFHPPLHEIRLVISPVSYPDADPFGAIGTPQVLCTR
jgi:hypothetical protein